MPRDVRWDNVVIVDHPLIQHRLTALRDERTSARAFRELVKELAIMEAYEYARSFELVETSVRTPVTETVTRVLADTKMAVIPIMRAGLGMVDGVLRLFPDAVVGHIGLYRDPETLKPVQYYCKLPEDIGNRHVLIVDPMLATGGSASAAVQFLREYGTSDIDLLVLIAAPEGIDEVNRLCKNVTIYACAVDNRLDEHGYIVPGLGDAGDRLFGTK